MSKPRRIGLVLSYSLAYCRGIMRGVKAYAQTKQDWIFTPVAPEDDPVTILRRLRPAGVIAHVYTTELAAALKRLRRPLVNVSGVLADFPAPRVGLDDEAIGRTAAQHLLDRGLRHFAFVGHPGHGYSVRRETAFRAAVEAAGHAVASYLDPVSHFDPRGRLWALDLRVRRWLTRLPRPVGVFACNDLWGAQLSEVCRQAGLGVPEEVAMLGVDNDDLLCDLARPSLSSVAVPAEAVGFRAAALLDRLMAGGAPPAKPTLLGPIGVVSRQSSDILAIEDADVSEAVRYIRDRAHEPVTIDSILDTVAVSRRSLERRFRRVLGRGIWDEIRRVHVARARELLANTNMSMAEVAVAAGFSDGKHLAVVFRQELGLTPSEYRRGYRHSRAEKGEADARRTRSFGR
jgi:LacI family transcriptional regulator